MSKSLGGWIHSFSVTETSTHKKGYTVYKITSIVFPRAIPEALTCITVWKRFHEIKKLYRDLSKRHKSLQLHGHVPEPKEISSYFKRFDPAIIQARKSYILQLLDYAAQHPALYKSHPFLSFFENGLTPNTSPLHHLKTICGSSNIEAICDSLDLTYGQDISLIDPNKDSKEEKEKNDVQKEEQFNNNDELAKTHIVKGRESNEDNDVKKNGTNCSSSKSNGTSSTTSQRFLLAPTISFEGDDTDYIYEAACIFSQAVQAEVNQDYREAYDKYKLGVDKLLTGSKDDLNEDRKFIAKAKVAKYMSRADDLYERYLLNIEDNKKTLQLSIDITDSTKEIYLERPWNQLSKFKVLQIIDNAVMQVQDVTNKSSIYIMKAIEKPSSSSTSRSIFLPQDVPYMVKLLGFFQSETTIYLLLREANGGKLFDHIRNSTLSSSSSRRKGDIEENTSNDKPITTTMAKSITGLLNQNSHDANNEEKAIDETKSMIQPTTLPTKTTESLLNNFDSGFIELLNEYKKESKMFMKDDDDDNNNATTTTTTTEYADDNDGHNIQMETSLESLNSSHSTRNSKDECYDEEITDYHETSIQQKNTCYDVPSFDILSEDMNVQDLLSCSQKLLQSVSNTIEQFKERRTYDDAGNDDNDEILQQNEEAKQGREKNYNSDEYNDATAAGNQSNQNDDKNTISSNKLKKTDIILNVNDSSSNSFITINNSMQLVQELEEMMHLKYKQKFVLPEVRIKQWAKELITAIDSLHQKGVILGDLRPDNLLLGSKGQLLLTYFYQNEGSDDNNARHYVNYNATEYFYVAPERPLTIKSDWWSFGVILFELLTGYTFKLCHPGNLFCYLEPQYPDDVEISDVAKDLLNQALQCNPEYRIGIHGIKTHRFFEGTKWDDIAKLGVNSY